MAFSPRPTIEYVRLSVFSPPMPFSASDSAKVSASLSEQSSVDYSSFPADNEMICANVRLAGPFSNSQPITISFSWVRESDGKTVYTVAGTVPAPTTQGFEYWNWYGYRCWIGKAAHEINGPGKYSCSITIKGEQGTYFSQQLSMQVTGEPPPTKTALLRIKSQPTNENIVLDNNETGKKTPSDFQVSTGKHKIGIYGSDVQTKLLEINVPENGTETTIFLELLPPPEKPWYEVLFGNVATFWTSWLTGNTAARDTAAQNVYTYYFGSTEAQNAIGLQPKTEMQPWELALALTTIGPVVQAPATAITTKGASEILALGIKDKKGLITWFKSLTNTQAAKVMEQLSKSADGKAAIEVLQRVMLDSAITLSKWKILAMATGAAVGLFGLMQTLNFFGFLNEEAIQTRGVGVFTLISNKQWKEAAVAIKEYRASVESMVASVDALMNIPILNAFLAIWWPNYKNAALAQVTDYETLIATQAPTVPPEEGPPIPPEEPENAGYLQLLVYDSKTNASINATLVVDGISQEYHLHAYNVALSPGPHELRVEEEGYLRYEDTVLIEKNKVLPVNVFLEKEAAPTPPTPPPTPPPEEPPEPEKGRVQITSNVEASIFVAGVDTGEKTPAVLEYPAGILDITLKAEGYLDASGRAYIKQGELYIIALVLRPEEEGPAKHKLWRVDVDSEPMSAKIHVNFAFTDKYTPDYVLLLPGTYVFSLTKSGYKRFDQSILLEEI